MMSKKQISALVAAGMGLLVAGIVVALRTSLPDTVKGLLIGVAIGILALPVIFRVQGRLHSGKH